MATQTTHYSLVKPAYEDQADVQAINGNMDIIDEAMHNNEVGLEQAEDNIDILMARQSANGTFNAAAYEYIVQTSSTTFRAQRVGLMLVVTLIFPLTGSTTTNDFVTIGTLPENFYPDRLYVQQIPIQGKTSMISLSINSNGDFKIYRPSTDTGVVRAIFSVPLLPSLL